MTVSRSPSLALSATTTPAPDVSSGFGRAAVVAHVDRWLEHPRPADDHAVLVVLDVDLDRALPVGDAEESTRRHRLARYVERALRSDLAERDAVARIDHGRFAVLRTGLSGERGAAAEAAALARRVEAALAGRIEGHGARVTCGGTMLARGGSRGGRATLGAVTGAMLAGKLLSDDRVVVVVAPGG